MDLAELACALPLAWEASLHKAPSFTTGAQWRFESVDWSSICEAGQHLLQNVTLDDYLCGLELTDDNVPRLLVIHGPRVAPAVRSAWISVSVALINNLEQINGGCSSINEILASLRVDASARKIVTEMTNIVDNPVLAAVACELSSSTVNYSQYRGTGRHSPWRARLDRAVIRSRSRRRPGEFWLGQRQDPWTSDDDLTITARIANEAFNWRTDHGGDFVAALHCDVRSIEDLVEWDRDQLRWAKTSRQMHDSTHAENSNFVANRAVPDSR
ncbi:hypothetical protein GCM10009691_30530 [Brevibacterium picturae]|uniref:Uncharacterized protein n=2 Tax=Brevibacterium picturae TaxID=260553 RepID=A0ABP4N1E5_9MICO